MRYGISLSGESLTPLLASTFTEVSLIRSEYLFRNAMLYPSHDSSEKVIVPYISKLGKIFNGDMWYRTLDVDTAEANILTGCDAVIVEHDRLRGLRGIRRSISYPDAYISELRALSLCEALICGVITPFISEISEATWAATTIKTLLPNVRLAAMIEVPSAIWLIPALPRLGFSRIVIGCNDLGSLSMGRIRYTQQASASSQEFKDILTTITSLGKQYGLEVRIAGYFNPSLFNVVKQLDADVVSMHYSQLDTLLGLEQSLLPELGLLSSIKSKTRNAIEDFNQFNGVHQTLY